MAFLDSFVNQSSAEKMLGGVNTAMRKHEHGFAGDPWVVHRPQGQRRELTQRTRGFAWQALRYYDPVKRQTRPVGRENPAN